MSWAGIIKLAFISLGRNKMRSFLTALGIIIGVSSVVAMVGLGLGAYSSVQENVSRMGTNLIMVVPGATSRRGMHGPRGGATNLSYDDARAILLNCPSVGAVSPIVRSSGQAIYGNRNWSTSVMGVNESFLEVSNRDIEDGRYFTMPEIRGGLKVAVIGRTVADQLFGTLNPIGQTIRFRRMPITIIGVMETRGDTAMGGDQDDIILMPFRTVQRRILGITHVNMINVSARSAELVDSARDEIQELLNRRLRIRPGDEEQFFIRTQDDIAEMAGSTLAIVALLLGSIASVSLIVGGIGIMNIMLVSVTERTREIGIRMAIGAKTRDILYQFLVEAVTLSCLGGTVGIIGGITLAKLMGHFVQFEPLVSVPAMIISFIFSGAVGIFFGLYPAWKASKMDPIEAFRFE